jgi:DNA polymerase-3 subunit beta
MVKKGRTQMTYQAATAIVADPATAVIERAPLTRAFDIVLNAVEKRNSIPILSNARLMGDGASLFVTSTDLDIEITVAVPAAADSRFGLTLPAHTMRDFLKKATASDFVAFSMPELHKVKRKGSEWIDGKHVQTEIEVDEFDSPAVVDFERVKYRLQALPVCDWPIMEGPKAGHRFTLAGAAFWSALDSTMAAISQEETRYYLNGIFAHVIGDTLRFAATDGHRLYKQEMPAPAGSFGMPGVIIPRKAVAVLHKLLKGKACPASVSIEVTGLKIRFMFDDVTITSKLIDGTFPDYQRVIPANNDKRATFKPADMLEAIRAVSLVQSEKGRACKFSFESGKCELAVTNADVGSAAAEVSCDYSSDRVEIGFNSAYLADAIPTAGEGDVSITLSDAGTPILITGNREGWIGVLMPMRV